MGSSKEVLADQLTSIVFIPFQTKWKSAHQTSEQPFQSLFYKIKVGYRASRLQI